MKTSLLMGAAYVTCLALSSTANAANFSFTGTLPADDSVQLFNFTADGTSTVTLLTYSYAGGTQADGNIVAAGGFDPILALFDSAGNLIDQNDDGSAVPAGPITGYHFDTRLDTTLTAGDYTVAVMQYDNFASGTLSGGFSESGNPTFTAAYGCSQGQFCDVGGHNRTNAWAFDVLNVSTATSVVPVPAAIWLFSSGLLGLVGFARKKAV